MRRRATLLACLVVMAVAVPSTAALAIDDVNTKKIEKAVTVNGILQHERVLQRIANNNGGNRASGTPGYDASAAYVTQKLTAAGYEVSSQEFEFPYFEELSPATLSQVSPTAVDIATAAFDYSGSGEVEGTLVAATNLVIPPDPEGTSSTAGCLPTDFVAASATEPQVALVQRGGCDFAVKAANALAAGYEAVIIFNEGNPGRTDLVTGTLGAPTTIPVVGASYADGLALYEATQAGAVTVSLSTDTVSETRTTTNVLADWPEGDPNRVVVVGAHLDSVAAGPGINDNGSGTATILETAIQLAKVGKKPQQQVRFAFWGAEESGLLGSEYYVANLSDDELGTIYANLNFDMLGSTNYVRFVYDGDGSENADGLGGPPGSAQIESLFTGYFDEKGLASAPTAFDGRSDYGPFIAAGIPAGGLFSGAEGVKTAEEAEIFGGTAGEAYDPCYHQACDTISNLSTAALNELGDAVAHSVQTLVRTKSGFFEDGSRMAVPPQLTADDFDYRGGSLVR